MFYDIFKDLCNKKDVSPSRACLDMGLSRSLGAKWKNTGANPSYEVLTKIADYFDVSVDYLLGNKQKEKASSLDEKKPEDLTFDDFTYAMHNESGNLSAEDKEILLNLARDLAKHRMEKDRRKEK